MRKTIFLLLTFAFVLTVAAPVMASDLPKPIHKFTTGTMQVITSPFVIYDHTKSEVSGADFKAVGLVKGLLTSPFHMVKQAGSGAIDMATFPIDK